MELSVEPLTVPFLPDDWASCQQSLEDWNEAYRRVESYFAALRVDNKLLLSSLVLKILGRASERLELEPDRPPVELAAEETDRLLVEWFRSILNTPGAEPVDRLSARGRLALLLVDNEVPWKQYFLSDTPMSDEHIQRMRNAYVLADPGFRFVEMRPRPIDLGIVDTASRTMESMGRWRTLFVWAVWAAFAGLLTLLFLLTRT